MNNITDVYAPFKSNALRDECLALFLKIMYVPCVREKPNVVWKRPLKKVVGPINDQELREAIGNAGFEDNHMRLSSLGKVITEVLVGNHSGWEPSGYRRPETVYVREYKRMLTSGSLIRDVTLLRELLAEQNVYLNIVDDLLGLSQTWRYAHFKAWANFRGKLGHREKFLSLLHAGPASIRVVASNGIESVAHHVFQLQALGYSIETTCGANGVVMFELAKEPVTYVENNADDCAYWGQCV